MPDVKKTLDRKPAITALRKAGVRQTIIDIEMEHADSEPGKEHYMGNIATIRRKKSSYKYVVTIRGE